MELIMEQINKDRQCVNSLKRNILCGINNFYNNLHYAISWCLKFEVNYLRRAAKLI